MICNRCGTNNWETARYCQECGHSFGGYCQHCAHPLPHSAKFCIHCGLATGRSDAPALDTPPAPVAQMAAVPPPVGVAAPLPPTPVAPVPAHVADPASSRAPGLPTPTPQLDRFLPPELATKLKQARATGAMQGERRVVTMLFCDVKGSTAAAEQLDPEEWTEIINGAFEQMIQPVYKYEGTVARLIGDAILAFFGAPIAHEDDPQRAILAGLEIVEGFGAYQELTFARYGLRISARVGINTGLVVVGAVGSDLRMEYTAMGDAINLAARMEQTAEPGTVQVAEDTFRLAEPIFDFESLGGD